MWTTGIQQCLEPPAYSSSSRRHLHRNWLVPYVGSPRLLHGSNVRKPFFLYFSGQPRLNRIRALVTKVMRNTTTCKNCIVDRSNGNFATAAGRYGEFKTDKNMQFMEQSKFCFNPPGDISPLSKRIYDSIAARCIPVVVADGLTLPVVSNQLQKFSVIIPEYNVLTGGGKVVLQSLSTITEEELLVKQDCLEKVSSRVALTLDKVDIMFLVQGVGKVLNIAKICP
mmetsp:Transcript_25257/g.79859  ORF Transcript_25257/g.79859 Transcript_25257/m.79859 type:complete len:225 (+) Transcript_25257:220-894(+)